MKVCLGKKVHSTRPQSELTSIAITIASRSKNSMGHSGGKGRSSSKLNGVITVIVRGVLVKEILEIRRVPCQLFLSRGKGEETFP